MLPDWVSNPGPLTYESDALPIALRGPADYIANFTAYAELQIRGSIEDNSKVIFLIFQ